ncbi:MAG: hypothetical protein ACO1RT_03175 [Planctomycetaceae bacterium]
MLNICGISSTAWLLLLALCSSGTTPARSCSIFVLTDGRQTLFCNNEDWSNPRTKIWFVPGGSGRHGCVFVGFDDDWGQGGLNTDGLAFDWVAGFKETWELDPNKATAKGNSAQRMLETCSTVDEAIAFYEKHHEPSFAYGKMLVADRSGASAVIGATDGRLVAEKMKRSRGLGLGFGMRGDFAAKLVGEEPEPTTTNAAKILTSARQEGKYATKYSNVFDLRSGAIFVFRSPGRNDVVECDLATELEKGPHFYDIPNLREQLTQPLKPLTHGMKKN